MYEYVCICVVLGDFFLREIEIPESEYKLTI